MAARKRVLIVDDDPLFRASLRALLEHDLEVVGEARDSAEAVAFALPGSVDLIVMEVSKPRLSGVDATRALLERDPALAVVIIKDSDRARDGDPIAAGARAYVRRSSEFGDLAEILVSLGSLPAPLS